MNINQNARFALKLPADGMSYGRLQPVSGFSFGGGNAYTISFSFYFTPGAEGTLVAQQDGFSVSVADAQLVFQAVELGSVKAYLDIGLVAAEEFNHVDITFDKSKISLYINGILCKEIATTGTGAASPSPYELGSGYATYLCRFRIANYALPQAEIYKNIHRNTLKPEYVEANIDFSTATPADTGKNKLSFTCEGFCIPKNIVKSLTLPARGMAVPIEHPELPGSFSVLAKLYIADRPQELEALFSYGDYGRQDAFCLGIRNTGESYGFARVGETEVRMTEPLPGSRWADFAATFDGKTVKLFVDGVEKAVKILEHSVLIPPGKACVGNAISRGRSESYGFSGYLDTLCLFSTALSGDRLSAMVDQPPSVLSNDVRAIYSFSGNEPVELVDGGMLSFSGGAGIQLAENTVAAQSIPVRAWDFAGDKPELSAYEKWEAATILDMISQFLQTEHGLTPRFTERVDGITAYPPALLAYASNHLTGSNEAQLALSEYNKPEKNNLTPLISGLAATGGLMVVGGLLFACAPPVLKAAAAITTVQMIAKLLFVIAAVSAVALVTATIVKEMTDDPPAPPKPKPDVKFGVTLVSICFNHMPADSGAKSAINIKNDAGVPMLRPEWVQGGIESKCAYVQSALAVPEIEVCIAYVSTPAMPCTIVLTGNADQPLNSFSHSLTFAAPGSMTVKIPLSDNGLKTAGLGEKHLQINWTAQLSNGKTTFMGCSKHCMFLLPDMPVLPYSNAAEKPESLLDTAILSLCGKALAGTIGAGTVQQKLLEHVRTSPNLTATAQNNYARHTGNQIGFDSAAFFSAEKSGQADLGALDTCALFALLCRANGIPCNVAVIKSTLGEIRMQKTGGAVEYVNPVMFTNKVSALGGTEQKALEPPSTCYVNTNESLGCYNTVVYDPYYTVHLKDHSSVGGKSLPFSDTDWDISGPDSDATYREAFFIAGCFVAISGVIADISTAALASFLEATADSDPVGAISARGDRLVKDIKRPDFQPRVKRLINPGAYQDICHSISYDNIQSWTVGIINTRDRRVPPPPPPIPPTPAAILTELYNIRNAVFVGVPPANALERAIYNGATAQADTVRDLLVAGAALAGGVNMLALATAAKTFANLLFQAPPNLRAGDSSWNRSIGGSFDPISWQYFDGTNLVITNTGICLAGTIWPGPHPHVGPGFYLTNAEDYRRIDLCALIDRGKTVAMDVLSINTYNAKISTVGVEYDFVYSSNNQFYASGSGNYQSPPIYYWQAAAPAGGAWALI